MAASNNDVTIKVGSIDNTAPEFDALKTRLQEMANKVAVARVDVSDKEAVAELDKIKAQLSGVAQRAAKPKITVDGAARAEATLSAIDVSLDRLGDKDVKPKISVEGAARAEADIAAVDLSLARLRASSDETEASAGLMGAGLAKLASPMGALVAAGVVLSPVIATVATGAAGFGLAAYKAVSPIEAAAQATGGLKHNLDTLDSGQQRVGRSLLGLQGEFGKFSAALEPEALTAFSTGIKIADGLLHDVGPVAKATGGAIDGLLSRVDAEFRSGTWQQFFGFMAKNAGPDIQMLGTAFINVMEALPGLVQNLQPAATELLQVADAGSKLVAVGTKIQGTVERTGQSADKSGGMLGNLAHSAGQATEQTVPAVGAVLKLGQALGILSTSSGKTKGAAGDAAGGIGKIFAAAKQAASAVEQLDTDWNNLVGNFASRDQVFAQASESFSSLVQTIKSSGGSSATAHDAFDSYVESIGSGVTTLRGAGAGSAAINEYLSQQISRLKTLGPLNAAQQQQLQGLIKYQQDAAASTANMSKQQLATAKGIESQLVPQLKAAGLAGATARTDANALTTAIINTGTKSAATAGARAQLIADLEAAGMTAKQATAYVDGLERKLAQLKSPPPVNVVVNETSTFRVGGSTGRVARAAGGLITGGTPGRDSVPIMAMPGEVVVPTAMVQAGAVDHLRGRLPGFGGGGAVGGSRSSSGLPGGSHRIELVLRVEGGDGQFAKAIAGMIRSMGGDPAILQRKVIFAS